VKPVNILSAEERSAGLRYILTAYAPDWDAQIDVMTRVELRDLYASGREQDGRYEPIGAYVVPEDDGTITAIDNRSGEAWTENFERLGAALLWLMNDEMTATEARAAWEKLQKESLSL
jgi:hypothetical protein